MVSKVKAYAKHVVLQIDSWFPEDLQKLCTHFGVFNPKLLPKEEDPAFQEYGNASIDFLAEYYGSTLYAKIFEEVQVGSLVHVELGVKPPSYAEAKIERVTGEGCYEVGYTAKGRDVL